LRIQDYQLNFLCPSPYYSNNGASDFPHHVFKWVGHLQKCYTGLARQINGNFGASAKRAVNAHVTTGLICKTVDHREAETRNSVSKTQYEMRIQFQVAKVLDIGVSSCILSIFSLASDGVA
jgi:hypothetical protein